MPGHRIDEELELVCLQRAQAETLFALIQTHRAYLSRWLSWPQEIQSLYRHLFTIPLQLLWQS